MAVVVSDTTPLNYLVLIEAIDVLPRLYGRVLIPAVVWDEIAQPETPEPVLNWLAQSPSWLEVTNPMPSADPTLSHLDEGEAQAITLALERRADLLLIDERDGTAAARARGLTVIARWAFRIGPLVGAWRTSLRCSPDYGARPSVLLWD